MGRSVDPLSRLQPGERQGPQCSDKYGQSSTQPPQRAGMASSVGSCQISLMLGKPGVDLGVVYCLIAIAFALVIIEYSKSILTSIFVGDFLNRLYERCR